MVSTSDVTDQNMNRSKDGDGNGRRIDFPAIEGRRRALRYVAIYDYFDPRGATTAISAEAPHGMWILGYRDRRDFFLAPATMTIIAPATRIVDGRVRSIRANMVGTDGIPGWQILLGATSANGENIRTVQPIGEGNRVTRTRYFVRGTSRTMTRWSTDDDGTPRAVGTYFIPMSHAHRITVSSALRAPNIRPHATNPTLSIRRGIMLYNPSTLVYANVAGLPQGITDLTANPVFAENGVITNPNTTALEGLQFRTAATLRRPVSMPTGGITIAPNN